MTLDGSILHQNILYFHYVTHIEINHQAGNDCRRLSNLMQPCLR